MPELNFPLAWTELSEEETKRVKNFSPRLPFNDLIRFPGNVLVPRTFLQISSQIYNFPVREDDIWIVTYPKCGTTWTQEMVWQIVNNVDKEKGKMPLFTRSPFLEMGCLANKEIMAEREKEGPPPHLSKEAMDQVGKHRRDPIAYTKTLPGRRVIKCHLPMEFLPPGLVDKCKVVYVGRNPKDCAVSFYHHHLRDECNGPFEEFISLFEDELAMYGSYWHHILGGWEYRNHKNFRFIWFEQMKKDQKSVIQDLCELFDHPLSEQKIDELVEHLKFDNMKKNSGVNHSLIRPSSASTHAGDFMRKGVVGDWKNYFDEERTRKWEKWIQEKVEGTGLDITMEL